MKNPILQAISELEKRENLHTVLKKYSLNGNICELGLRDGYNLYHMAQSEPKLMVGVDVWREDGNIFTNDLKFSQEKLDEFYRLTMARLGMRENCKIIRDYTHYAVDLFPDEFFDVVYIDADHSYEGASRDIKLWYPKVKIGGLFAGHDYPGWDTVVRAVDEFVKEKYIDELLVHAESWFTIKEHK